MTDQDTTRAEWPPPAHATYIEILVGDYLDDNGEVAYLWAPAARQANGSYYVAVAWSPDVQALRPIDLVFDANEEGCAWREITPERFARHHTKAGGGRINIPPHTVRAGDACQKHPDHRTTGGNPRSGRSAHRATEYPAGRSPRIRTPSALPWSPTHHIGHGDAPVTDQILQETPRVIEVILVLGG